MPLTSPQPIEAEPQISLNDTEGDELLASIADEELNDVHNDIQLLRGLSEEFLLDHMGGTDGDSLAKNCSVDDLCNQEPSKDDDTVVNNMADTTESVNKSVTADVLCKQEFSKDDAKAETSIPFDADEIFNNLNAEEEVVTEDTGPLTNAEVPTEDTGRNMGEGTIEEKPTNDVLPIQNCDQDVENLDDSDEENSIDADDREINR